MSKRKITILAAATLILLGILAGWWYITSNKPTGKCFAPNDALVDCEKLRQNPTKTDWTGNE